MKYDLYLSIKHANGGHSHYSAVQLAMINSMIVSYSNHNDQIAFVVAKDIADIDTNKLDYISADSRVFEIIDALVDCLYRAGQQEVGGHLSYSATIAVGPGASVVIRDWIPAIEFMMSCRFDFGDLLANRLAHHSQRMYKSIHGQACVDKIEFTAAGSDDLVATIIPNNTHIAQTSDMADQIRQVIQALYSLENN